jgi:signal transduction histidine kinase/CheY-like chemotaxis protein
LAFAGLQGCLGTAAVLLLWGTLKYLKLPIPRLAPPLFIGFLFVWSYAGGLFYQDDLVVQLPIFILFSAASLFVGTSFYWLRRRRPVAGTLLFAVGLLLCGAHVATYPFSHQLAGLHTAGFLTSTVVQLYIAVSMIVLLLEEVRQGQEEMRHSHADLYRSHEQLRRNNEQLRQNLTKALQEAEAARSGQEALRQQVLSAEQQSQHWSEQSRRGETWKRAYDELRDNQAAGLRKESLRAMGRMASVIAHDLSNLLSPIVSFSELLLKQDTSLGESPRRYLGQILTAGEDISAMIERMRDFYRRREHGPLSAIHLKALVEKVVDQTRPQWFDAPLSQGIRIELTTELAEDLPLLHGVESEIQEALANLILNAVQAMPRSGQIVVATRALHLKSASGQGQASHVVLEVRDQGTGMEDYTRQHCLEPFFTTKGHRGGRGLGLAMVYGLMERHKGQIEIETEPGKGTTMRLVFPRRAAPSDAAPSPVVADASPLSLRILCVDDEPVLGLLLKQLLELKGHLVDNAYGGLSALDAFREAQREGKPFDVVVTDLAMPGVDGREVTRTIKAESPQTPVVLLTGYGTLEGEEEDKSPTPVDGIVSKPPRIEELNQVLVQVTRRLRSEATGAREPTPASRN